MRLATLIVSLVPGAIGGTAEASVPGSPDAASPGLRLLDDALHAPVPEPVSWAIAGAGGDAGGSTVGIVLGTISTIAGVSLIGWGAYDLADDSFLSGLFGPFAIGLGVPLVFLGVYAIASNATPGPAGGGGDLGPLDGRPRRAAADRRPAPEVAPVDLVVGWVF